MSGSAPTCWPCAANWCRNRRSRRGRPLFAAPAERVAGFAIKIDATLRHMPGPYELYLVRHGIAEQRGDKWPDDTKRPLSEDGIERMQKNARGLERLGAVI